MMMSILAWAILYQAAADTPPPEPSPRAEAKNPTQGFFRAEGVDFWGEAKASAEEKSVPAAARQSVWAEPIRLPDGRTTIYVPPPAVLGFLEAPSRETARGYLAWQEERAKKLKAAMELLRDLKEEKAKEARQAEASPPAGAPPPPPGASAYEILYFKKPGCPWCARQDAVLAGLLRSRSAIKVRVVGPEEAPELWKRHEVTAVPTLVLSRPDGTHVKLAGFQSEERLLRQLGEVDRAEK